MAADPFLLIPSSSYPSPSSSYLRFFFFKVYLLLFLCVWVFCLHICGCVPWMSRRGCYKWTAMWVLGIIGSRPSGGASLLVTTEPTLHPHAWLPVWILGIELRSSHLQGKDFIIWVIPQALVLGGGVWFGGLAFGFLFSELFLQEQSTVWDIVSLCSPGGSGTHQVEQTGLEFGTNLLPLPL